MIKLKSDKFRKSRGGYSRLLQISCERCGNDIALYQKDGPGPLKRMYVDRIIRPDILVDMKDVSIKKFPNLACSKCQNIIGIPFIYEKEKRPAFRVLEGSVRKKITRAS